MKNLEGDKVLWENGKYGGKRKRLEVFYSNHHAFEVLPRFPSELKTVQLYRPAVQAVQPPPAEFSPAWLEWFGRQLADIDGGGPAASDVAPPQYQEVEAAAEGAPAAEGVQPPAAPAVEAWGREKAREGCRVWLLRRGTMAVASDGTAIRPAAEVDDIRQTLGGLSLKHEAPEKLITALSYAFRLFREKNGLIPAGPHVAPLFARACVEPRPWSLPREAWPACEVSELDLAGAYPSFVSPHAFANQYYRQYKVPTNGRRWLRCSVNGQPTAEHLALTGFAILSSWQIDNAAHPAIQLTLAKHLAGPEPVLPTPLLSYCLSSGVLRCEVAEIAYAVDVAPLSFYPAVDENDAEPIGDKNKMARLLLGCLTRNPYRTDVLIFDRNEAAALSHAWTLSGKLVENRPYGDATHIAYEEAKPRASFPHVRAFMLAYAAISLFEKVRQVQAAGVDVYKVITDGIYVRKEKAGQFETARKGMPARWGEWRAKRSVDMAGEEREHMPVHPVGGDPNEPSPIAPERLAAQGCAPPSTAPALSSSPLRRFGLSVLFGQGGSGKTHRAIQETHGAGLKVLYLAPTNRLTREKAKEFPGLAVSTYHKHFKISMKGEFSSEKMFTARRYQVYVMDECCYLGREFLQPLIEYAARAGALVCACGDPGQLRPVEGEAPGDWLRSIAGHFEQVATDFRSRCEHLRALKSRMYLQDDATQLAEMRAALPLCKVSDLFAQWQPGDLVIGATNRYNDRINARIFAENAKKYPAPVPFVWAPTEVGKAVRMVVPPGGGDAVEVVRGDIVEVPFSEDLKAGDGWQLAYALTVHKAQGLTLEGGRIWVLDDKLDAEFTHNAAYTVVSRARTLDQLRIVKF